MFYIVTFHADGGQMCIGGLRCYETQKEADDFAARMRAEPGHSCGPQSVKQWESERWLSNIGVVYPGVANMGREGVFINGKLHLC
jgi:hypothetical protein